jgi:hypothetical protein
VNQLGAMQIEHHVLYTNALLKACARANPGSRSDLDMKRVLRQTGLSPICQAKVPIGPLSKRIDWTSSGLSISPSAALAFVTHSRVRDAQNDIASSQHLAQSGQ